MDDNRNEQLAVAEEQKPAKRKAGRPVGTTREELEARRIEAEVKGLTAKDSKRLMNKDVISFCKTMLKWDKINMHDLKQVQDRTNKYLDAMEVRGLPVSIEAYAAALKITRQTLYNYINGDSPIEPEIKEYLNDVREVIKANLVMRLDAEDRNPASKIFLAKNNYGYADKQEYIVTPNNPFGNVQSPDAIAAKYADLVEIEE